MKIAGWVLSGLIAILLIGPSAMSKLVDWPGKAEAFEKSGYTIPLMQKIGFVEILCAVLFLLPRTSFLGAILLTGYLGGATEVHVRMGEPFFIPIVVGVVVWIALGLRNPKIFSLAFGDATRKTGAEQSEP